MQYNECDIMYQYLVNWTNYGMCQSLSSGENWLVLNSSDISLIFIGVGFGLLMFYLAGRSIGERAGIKECIKKGIENIKKEHSTKQFWERGD